MAQDPDWDHLRSLLALARGGTFTAAAKALGVKHTTISRHVQELEADIRSKILLRDAEGLRMTGAGERLVAAAEAMETQLRNAQEDIVGRDSLVSGSVRIGAPDGFGAIFLAPRLVRLMSDHPSLNVQLVAMPRVFNLSKREADIAIALAPPDHGRLISRKLCRYSLSLYASQAYLAVHAPICEKADLARHRFISYIDDLLYTSELDYINEVSSRSQAMLQSSNLIAQLQATLSGYGLCILPDFIARDHADLRRVLPEQIRLTRTWFMLIHEDQRDLSRIRTVCQFLVDQIRESNSILLDRQPVADGPASAEAP